MIILFIILMISFDPGQSLLTKSNNSSSSSSSSSAKKSNPGVGDSQKVNYSQMLQRNGTSSGETKKDVITIED